MLDASTDLVPNDLFNYILSFQTDQKDHVTRQVFKNTIAEEEDLALIINVSWNWQIFTGQFSL